MKSLDYLRKNSNNFSSYPMVPFKTFHAIDSIINKEYQYIPSAFPISGAELALNNLSTAISACKPYYMNAFDAYKPTILQQVEWNHNITQNTALQNLSLAIQEFANPLISISQLWTSNYSNILDDIRKILLDFQHIPAFDFSNVDERFKKSCLIMLKNGYYPSKRLHMGIIQITKLKNKKQINEFICDNIENVLLNSKNRIKKHLNKYNKIINQIFKLYDEKEYRLCILSIINLLSIIYNSTFDNTDFTEKELKDKLTNLGLLNDTQTKYSIFSPYYVEPNYNTLLINCRKNPSNYKKYPYCRNAILHGYSKKFGNKRNTLRWFSVLLNTIDLLEAVEKKQKI